MSKFELITKELELISNRSQFEALARQCPEFCNEIFCVLFDDLDIKNFAIEGYFSTDKKRETFKKFVQALEAAADELPENVNVDELLENANWQKAQHMADAFLQFS